MDKRHERSLPATNNQRRRWSCSPCKDTQSAFRSTTLDPEVFLKQQKTTNNRRDNNGSSYNTVASGVALGSGSSSGSGALGRSAAGGTAAWTATTSATTRGHLDGTTDLLSFIEPLGNIDVAAGLVKTVLHQGLVRAVAETRIVFPLSDARTVGHSGGVL